MPLMSLAQKIREDMKNAMRAKDERKLLTLRGLLSAFTNELVAQKRKPSESLEDSNAIAVIKRAVKQRKDSISQFLAGGRQDLVAIEETELAIIEAYLPKQASEEEILMVAKKKKDELATDKSKSGILVGAVMKEFAGNADGMLVKKIVDGLFA